MCGTLWSLTPCWKALVDDAAPSVRLETAINPVFRRHLLQAAFQDIDVEHSGYIYKEQVRMEVVWRTSPPKGVARALYGWNVGNRCFPRPCEGAHRRGLGHVPDDSVAFGDKRNRRVLVLWWK